MKVLSRIIEKIFYILFFVIAIIVLNLTKEKLPFIKVGGDQGEVQTIICILFVAILAWIYAIIGKNGNWKRDIIGLALISMLLRFGMILFIGIDTNQVSDFQAAYLTALDNIPFSSDIGVNFPNWGMYPVYLKAIISVFGEGYLTIINGNAICGTISVCLIYNLCRFFTDNRKKAILAALIFCVWPSLLAYTIVLTPEHISIVFVLMALNIFAYGYKRVTSMKMQYILLALSGCSLSASDFFKPVAPVVIIALIIIFIILDLPEVVEKIKAGGNIKRIAVNIFIKILCFIAVYTLTGQIGDNIIRYSYGKEINENVSLYYIAIGLNGETNGNYSADLAQMYTSAIYENEGYDTANELMKEVIGQELTYLQSNWREFFTEKFIFEWQADDYMYWVLTTINPDGKSLLEAEQWYIHYRAIIYYWYAAVWLLIAIMACVNVFKKKQDRLLFFSELFIVGMMCLLLLSECQLRYKCVIYPYLSIVAAYGIDESINVIRQCGKSIREKTRVAKEKKL